MGSPASQRLSTPREAPSGSTNCTPAPIPQVAVMACLACERFATVVDGEEKEGVLGQWLLDCDVAAQAQVVYAADLDAGAAGDDGGGKEGISGLFPTTQVLVIICVNMRESNAREREKQAVTAFGPRKQRDPPEAGMVPPAGILRALLLGNRWAGPLQMPGET